MLSEVKKLEAVQAGDEVIITSGGAYRSKTIAEVDRVTATQIILKNTSRYSKKSGRRVGLTDSWTTDYIEVGTPQALAKIREDTKLKDLRTRVERLTEARITKMLKHMSGEQLEQLEAYLIALPAPNG